MVLTQVNEHTPRQFLGKCGTYSGPGSPPESGFGCHHIVLECKRVQQDGYGLFHASYFHWQGTTLEVNLTESRNPYNCCFMHGSIGIKQ